MDAADMGKDLEKVLITEEQIHAKLEELAGEIATEYAGKDLLLVGVLKGAVMVMADLMRALPISAPVDWMAVSRCCASRMRPRSRSTSSGWASTSPTSSSSATASTTPSSTEGSDRSAPSHPTSTADVGNAAALGDVLLIGMPGA